MSSYSYSDALSYAAVVARKFGRTAFVRWNKNNGFYVSDHSPSTNKGIGRLCATVECRMQIRELREDVMKKAA